MNEERETAAMQQTLTMN